MVYIDGLNLHYALVGFARGSYLWLDLVKFGTALLDNGQTLAGIEYFTARYKKAGVSGLTRQRNQTAFIAANRRAKSAVIHESFFVKQTCECDNCFAAGPGFKASVYTEKLTDTHIASRMIGDAVRNLYDTAILVSRDNDLAPPVREVLRLFPEKKLVVASPGPNVGKILTASANDTFVIPERVFADSQLPDTVIARNGAVLTRPPEWSA